jgi:putative nucleotidyltransferase with HDIG domain
MKNAGSTLQITTDSLRVGMYIHLDVGWMSHPFPLSSFRIGSEDQIATIRSLGLQRVRWSPEHSALLEAEARAEAAQRVAGEPAPPQEADDESTRRRAALAAQRAGLVLCERQFAEAARECRQLTDMVVAQPAAARDRAQSLTQGLVTKMLGAQELCIRLLTEAAGDRAGAHAVNVTLVSLLMGRSFGFAEAEMLDLGVGALLHDIGKLDLPARVRHREEHFTPSEVRFYEEHVTHGVAHARKMGLTPGASLVIAQHHEHADGSGFPLRIGRERMSTAAGIVALVNRYDNLCNPAVQAKALTPHEALSLLFAQGKNRFDAAILGAFIKMMGVYPPGSVVQLTDDRYAMVAGVNATRPLRPRVIVLDPRLPAEDSLAIELEHETGLGIRRSLRSAALPADVQAAMSPRQRVAYFFEPVVESARP